MGYKEVSVYFINVSTKNLNFRLGADYVKFMVGSRSGLKPHELGNGRLRTNPEKIKPTTITLFKSLERKEAP